MRLSLLKWHLLAEAARFQFLLLPGRFLLQQELLPMRRLLLLHHDCLQPTQQGTTMVLPLQQILRLQRLKPSMM